ncbi:membrane-associated progesterone receptor component, partial [Tremellales sp. Uapishka_1]
MTWFETLTSTPALIAGAVGASAFLYTRSSTSPGRLAEQAKEFANATQADGGKAKMAQAAASVMSAPAAELAPPKHDPISPSALAQYDGSDPSKPIYVAIKGDVYDVSAKKEMYGPGAGYNVFAGKDASKGLGMSSLDVKDAIPDYTGLNEAQMKTLDQWQTFFQKRYNIVGKVQSE